MNGFQAAIVRLAVLAVLFANQALIVFGWNPLPFSEEELFAFFSTLALAAQSLWTWHKNNNVTKEAQSAQRILDAKKAKKELTK